MKKLTNTQTKEIKDRLPFVQNLVEGEDADYQMIFVSIFDHWLTQDEFETEINTEDRTELNIRREKFQNFIDGIYNLTDIYSWKYKRHNRFFVYPFTSLNQLTKEDSFELSLDGEKYAGGSYYIDRDGILICASVTPQLRLGHINNPKEIEKNLNI